MPTVDKCQGAEFHIDSPLSQYNTPIAVTFMGWDTFSHLFITNAAMSNTLRGKRNMSLERVLHCSWHDLTSHVKSPSSAMHVSIHVLNFENSI